MSKGTPQSRPVGQSSAIGKGPPDPISSTIDSGPESSAVGGPIDNWPEGSPIDSWPDSMGSAIDR